MLDSIYQLLGFGFDLRRTDGAAGDTALTAVRALLDRRLYHEAHLLALGALPEWRTSGMGHGRGPPPP